MTKVLLIFFALYCSHSAFGQDYAGDTIGKTVEGADNAANGAYQASDTADDYDSKRKRLEHEAREHPDPNGQPNHELMEKAHHAGHLARMSRLQAREFAREALQALASRGQQTAQTASAPKMSNGQPFDVLSLQRIADVPITAEETPQTSSTGSAQFQSSGGSDTSGLPVGSLANPADGSTAATAAAAKPMPYGIAPGTPYGYGAVQYGASRDLASFPNPVGIDNGMQQGTELKAQSTDVLNPNEHIVTAADGVKDKKTLDANRARILKQMGLRAPASVEETGPIRAKSEDIFMVVHTHYKSLNDNGTFFSGEDPLPPTPGPSRNPPKFIRGF